MKMGICGTGVIASSMATLMVGNGVDTVVVGRSQESLDKCQQVVSERFDFLVAQDKVTASQKAAAMGKLTLSEDYADLVGSEFVLEAVWENIPLKQEIYGKVEQCVGKDTIIASATSALLPDVISEQMTLKERFVVAHPIQPADLQPIIELVLGSETSVNAKEKAKDLLETVLKRQVVLMEKAAPGFIYNRFQHLLFREGLYMVEQGIASAEDVDKTIRFALSKRYGSIGLFEYFDDVGFSLHNVIGPSIYPHVCSDLHMNQLVTDGIAAGKTGIADGVGMHDWSNRDVADYQYRKQAPYLDGFDWDLPESES
ncbi:3-hydroxyacyl-CoA dehydrogenase family protein [Bengtsoniella intestinalis]|uniref:3-hydroxyacyl-CoA dehydrogenase family protein n=1 Tax=Bengtsoniella intestinalis TaxID=3073143 RepID=UPI00391F7E58